MKKVIFFSLIWLSTLFTFAQNQRISELVPSKKLDGVREVWIELPEGYQKDPKKKFPLILVLDGAYLLDVFSGTYKYATYWDEFPEAILVGISQEKSNDRFDDSEANMADGGLSDRSGKFFEFIGADLLPLLEKKYRVGNFKVIAGHDVTAGFLHFFLFKDQPLFQGYIAISPEFPNTLEEKLAQRFSFLKQKIFYYHATSDTDDVDIVENCNYVDTEFQKNPNNLIQYQYDLLKGRGHYSIVPFAVPNALYHIFGNYQPISPKEYQDKISVLTDNQTQYLVDKYNEIEKNFQTNTKPRFSDFRAIEAAILKHKNYQEFGRLAEIAKKHYPKTLLENYFLGLMFEKQNYLDKAAKEYKNGFTKSPIGDITNEFLIEKVATIGRK